MYVVTVSSADRVLNLRANALVGTFPDVLSVMLPIQYLNLGSNNFMGTIPTYISQWTSLR